jgi:exodeoxyribonuclease VII large subunit
MKEPRESLSVSEITGLIRESLESRFMSVTVEGEISNCKSASSGHLYFNLKDSGAILQAVMFRFKSRALGFEVRDGMKVKAFGSITVYPPRGNYQLLVESMRQSGIGDILAELEERKRRLGSEGLFDPERKRPLPRLPARIAVITSPTGAAIRDILSILHRRNCGIDIAILPAAVQGDSAPRELAARIEEANRFDLGDVIIIGRGGGSLEDLLAFSDELVVRAVAGSRLPVISAVGHETDWALCDFAADIRAPTPSAAAELVSESRAVIAREIAQLAAGLEASIRSRLDAARNLARRFEPGAVEAYFMKLVSPLARRRAEARETLSRGISERLAGTSHRLGLAARSLELSSPRAIMQRGFAIVRKESGGMALRGTEGLSAEDVLRVSFARGELKTVIKEIHP